MGCNYYIKKMLPTVKALNNGYLYNGTYYSTLNKITSGNDKFSAIVKIKNGYIFEDTYYETLDDIPGASYHIGKSSFGWNFIFRTYESIDGVKIDKPEDLLKLVELGYNFYDEYDDEVSASELLDIITNRKGKLLETYSIGETVEDCGSATVNKFGLLTRHRAGITSNYDLTYDTVNESYPDFS